MALRGDVYNQTQYTVTRLQPQFTCNCKTMVHVKTSRTCLTIHVNLINKEPKMYSHIIDQTAQNSQEDLCMDTLWTTLPKKSSSIGFQVIFNCYNSCPCVQPGVKSSLYSLN